MRTILLACFASCALAGCIDLKLTPQLDAISSECSWRVDSRSDVAEWLEIEHGIDWGGEKGLEYVKRLLSQEARVFPAARPWIDFDELERDQGGAGVEPEPATEDDASARLLRRFVELAPTFHVLETELVFDEEGRVTLWRRGRIERASEWLREIEAGFLQDMSRSKSPDHPFADYSFDAESFELFREQARAGAGVWRLDGHGFVVEAAMTEENARRCISKLAPDDVQARFAGGHLHLRYLPGEGGWIPSTFLIDMGRPRTTGDQSEDAPERDPDEDPITAPETQAERTLRIVDAAVAAGIEIRSVESYRALRQSAGLR